MVSSVEVAFKPGFRDAFAGGRKGEISDSGFDIESIRGVGVYTIEATRPTERFESACRELFADPLTQDVFIDSPAEETLADWDWMIHVRKKPGVKDNIGETSAKALGVMGAIESGDGASVYTSVKYFIRGGIESQEQADRIARQVLGYESVEEWSATSREAFKSGGYDFRPPKVTIAHKPRTEYIGLGIADDTLLGISRDRHLALNLDEMKAVKAYFARPEIRQQREIMGMDPDPSDVELEVIAQTWSEHCQHKIFKAKVKYTDKPMDVTEAQKPQEIQGLFKTYIKKAVGEFTGEQGWVVSSLWDNSGVMEFDDEYYVCFKCETHNSPSKKHPYGGAITGIVGVYRDPMGTGMGVKLIFGTYGFCTGSPFYKGNLNPDIQPARLLEGVRSGVQDGGNKSGVPTPFGGTFFHDGFIGKPGIFVEAAGLLPKEVNGKPGYEKMVMPGDLIVMCGGRVGIDGIHGATESSLEGGKHITLGHVQMGDPYTQKKMHDFLLDARDKGMYHCVQDNGAGGLSSSVGEMGNDFGRKRPEAAYGFEMHLDRVPLKYQGLADWQIAVSESQERMSLAVAPDKIKKFMDLAKEYDVEATVLGEFNKLGKFHMLYKNETVACIDMDFLHDGVPQMELEAEWISPEARGLKEPVIQPIEDHGSFLKDMLARENVCSKEYIIRQFDHEVQATSVVKPLVGKDSDVISDGAVLRPNPNSNKALAISAGINPDLSGIDTYHMTAVALDEAIRRIIAVGGDINRIALNDNFVWPSPLKHKDNPDAKYKMAQLVRANQALYEYTRAFGTPCISGKDSMSMDSTEVDVDGNEVRVSAPPTMQFSAVGVMDSWEQSVTMDSKSGCDLVYVVGLTKDECGGSEFYRIKGETGLNVPKVDAPRFRSAYEKLGQAMRKGLVKSAHGCYKGGLGVALAQTAFAGGFGMDVELRDVPMHGLDSNDKVLYSESAGRFIVTVSPDKCNEFAGLMEGSDFAVVGMTTNDEDFIIRSISGGAIIKENIYELKKAWQSTFRPMEYQPLKVAA